MAGALRHRLRGRSEAAGQRANYGASPGDEDHAEPYVYVGPWTAEVDGELWNATGFTGAELALCGAARPPTIRWRAALELLPLPFEALTGVP